MKKFYVCSILMYTLFIAGFVHAESVALLDHKFQFDLPSGFTEMSLEEIQIKYPNGNPPMAAYANPKRSVSIAIVYSQTPLTVDGLDKFKSQMTEVLSRIIPGIEWKKNEIIEIKGKKWVHFEIMSNAIDTDIHNHMFMTDLNGKMLGVNLNATVAEYESMDKDFENVIKSLSVNQGSI